MQKTMTRLFTAVLMAALLVSASIMSVSAAEETHTCAIHDDSSIEWTPIYNDGAGSANIAKAGHYYLTDNLTMDEGVDSKNISCLIVNTPNATDEVVICMNGHSITPDASLGDATHPVRMLMGNVTLCNCNSEQGGALKAATATQTKPVLRVGNATDDDDSTTNIEITLTLKGNVHVDGNGTKDSPVAIYLCGVFYDGKLIMDNGSSVSNNHTTSDTGVIYLNGGDLVMNAGSAVSNNSVNTEENETNGHTSGTIVMYSTKTTQPRVCTFNLVGGTISGNTVNECGGGVSIENCSYFTMQSGTISGNTATGGGGGVNLKIVDGVTGTANFNIVAGNISNNNNNDGDSITGTGVYVQTKGKFTMSGSATIEGKGNLIYSESATSGSKIENGTITHTGDPNHSAVFAAGSVALELTNKVSIKGRVSNAGLLTISGGTIDGPVTTRGTGTTTITGGSIKGKVSVRSDSTGTFEISGGKFSGDTDAGDLAIWLQDGIGMKEIWTEDSDYVYTVGSDVVGLYSTGEHMEFKSSLDLGLYLAGNATMSASSVSNDYTAELTQVEIAEEQTVDVLFARNIAAKNMDTPITFTVEDADGNELFRKTMSIYDAAEKWVEDADKKTMVTDMINYGIEAQKVFNENNEATMTALKNGTATADAPVWSANSDACAVGVESAATLSLKEQIELNIYLEAAVDDVIVTGVTFDGVAYGDYDKASKGDYTRISFKDIPVKDVKGDVVINGTCNGNAFTVTYSIEDYVVNALAEENNDQKDLLVALQKYVDAVINYQG